jgi:hypothetical protein
MAAATGGAPDGKVAGAKINVGGTAPALVGPGSAVTRRSGKTRVAFGSSTTVAGAKAVPSLRQNINESSV